MTDFAFYCSFIVTFIIAVIIFLKEKKQAINSQPLSKRSLNKATLLVVFGGVLSGLVIFPFLVYILNLVGFPSSYGHGESLIAAPIFNFLFALILGITVRVLLDLQPIE